MKANSLFFVFGLGMLLIFFTSCSEQEDPVLPQVQTETFDIPATATFLRMDDNDSPSNPVVVNLTDLGITPGSIVALRTIGNFLNSPNGGTRDDAIGVFSASNQLLGTSELNRVVDAIDAGVDRVTDNTFEQNQVTDIPEDFRIDETQTQVVVPANAQFLFFGNADSKQSDNSDSPSGFSIEISF